MNRRTLKPLAVAGALAFTLAACGGPDSDFDTPGGSDPTTTKEPSESVSPHDPDDSDGSDNVGESDDTDADDSESSDTTSADIDLASDETPISASDALDISAKEIDGGDSAIVHAIELEYSDGSERWEWSVKTLVDDTDHKVKINADSGDIIKHEKDSTDDEEKAIDLDDPMPFSKAKDIALDARDGRIVSWKYEWDDGRYEYEFDIESDGHTEEVNVNAETGDAKVD